jgi:hypothetical protein
LRAGIARGRSCASILVIPRRKKSLCEAIHGRVATAGVGASWVELSGERKEGEGGGEREAQLGGGMGGC